ncbi:hypothetical protein BDQ12DRAFT_681365 [Crucibulum laeve]|uniref:DUF7330 domain-containing protein n=1 Tax=Crucibulum laeve TaxID=68775 RepID=A0A5C3M3R9_9AGAR|nr:hypothetical protein BDQ12DRAFT_681365 [Crucibulum laeve]
MIVDASRHALQTSPGSLVRKQTSNSKPPPYHSLSYTQPVDINVAGPSTPPLPSTPNSTNDPAPSVNQVHLHSGDTDITGAFFIDPSTPALEAEITTKKKTRKELLYHASFHSRKGAISLNLATTGNIYDIPQATVSISSRSGNIMINLLETTTTRPRMAVDAYSRTGDIIVFIPKTFSGVIQLNTRRGDLNILSGLSSASTQLKATEEEVILMIGNQSSAAGYDGIPSQVGDLCQLRSYTGKIIVGLSGRDEYAPKSASNFWSKLMRRKH